MGYLYRPKLKSDARSENLVGEVLRERPPGAREYGRCCGHEDSAGGRALVPEGTRGRVATGRPVLPRADRIRYDEVATDLRQSSRTISSVGRALASHGEAGESGPSVSRELAEGVFFLHWLSLGGSG